MSIKTMRFNRFILEFRLDLKFRNMATLLWICSPFALPQIRVCTPPKNRWRLPNERVASGEQPHRCSPWPGGLRWSWGPGHMVTTSKHTSIYNFSYVYTSRTPYPRFIYRNHYKKSILEFLNSWMNILEICFMLIV